MHAPTSAFERFVLDRRAQFTRAWREPELNQMTRPSPTLPLFLSTCLMSLVASFSAHAAPQSDVDRACQTITDAELRGTVRYLADDLLEGRGPATRGDQLARLYVQSQMEAMGLEPAAPGGGWQQTFELLGVKGHVPPTMKLQGGRGDLTLKFLDDFIAVAGNQP